MAEKVEIHSNAHEVESLLSRCHQIFHGWPSKAHGIMDGTHPQTSNFSFPLLLKQFRGATWHFVKVPTNTKSNIGTLSNFELFCVKVAFITFHRLQSSNLFPNRVGHMIQEGRFLDLLVMTQVSKKLSMASAIM